MKFKTASNLIKLSILFSLFTLTFSTQVFATNYVVTSSGTGQGSFAEAVMMANSDPADDVITFAEPNQSSYLGGVIIENNGTLTIEGNGAEVTIIRLFTPDNGRPILQILEEATVIVNNSTLSNGRRAVFLRPNASLTINNSVIKDNGVASNENASGGGIIAFLSSYLEINNSVVRNNRSSGGLDNYSKNPRVQLDEKTEVANLGSGPGSGGGIYSAGTLIINDSKITENLSNGSGGGISVFGSVTMRRSTLSENESGDLGGAIFGGDTFVSDSLVSNNSALRGGGIYSEGGFISNTTISGNTADFGGGIRNGGGSNSEGLFLRNVTITDNTASVEGGGILPILDSTTTDLGNTIVAGNAGSEGEEDILGNVTSSGYNLIGNSNGAIIDGDQTGNILDTNPLLAPLANNGGISMTHALQTDSPAINSGSNDLAVDQDGDPLVFDQRGEDFERISDETVDIGAFEVQQDTNAPNGNVKFDYNGDGKADLSVYRGSEGRWYMNDLNGGISSVQFGIEGDTIVPADYDGDGITDQGIFRNGKWYVKQSTDGAEPEVRFGLEGDIPIAGDFDGDGMADKAVYRLGVWYVLNSSDLSVRIEQFGLSDDKPLVGDFDGDGKNDLVVYRPSNRVWYILQSRDGFTALQFGLPDDLLVPTDYDGDGRTDIAIYRDGVWYIYNSSDETVSVLQFGIETDVPVPADYDGDGKADIAVYRDGIWFVLKSTNSGYIINQFGLAGDNPTPNAYVR